jgi:hypothetical protein
MFLLKRAICVICTVVAAAGCASRGPVKPSYDDAHLRPINQDLVSWMRRMNIDQPATVDPMPNSHPATQTHAIGQPSQNLIAVKGSDASNVTHVTLTPAIPTHTSLSTASITGESTPLPVGAAVLAAPSPPWVVPAGTSVRQALTAWSMRAGWTLIWDARASGPSLPRIEVKGDLLDALRALLRASQLPGSSYPLKVEAFPRQKIIHVADKD